MLRTAAALGSPPTAGAVGAGASTTGSDGGCTGGGDGGGSGVGSGSTVAAGGGSGAGSGTALGAGASGAGSGALLLRAYCFEGAAAPKGVELSWPPRVIKDAHRFVCSIHVNFTFVSDNIINKDRVMASDPTRLSSLVGTNLVQLGWIYAGLYFREKLVGMRTNNTVGYTLSQVIGPNLKKIADRPQTSEEYYQWDIMRFLPAAFNHW